MSSRVCRPWLKKVKRIIGRRLRSGSLGTEDALQLCVSSIWRQSSPPTASTARRVDHYSCEQLERFIRACHSLGHLAPDDAHDLFGELFPRAGPSSVCALTQLLTVVACAPASSSSISGGPSLAVSLYNRMHQAGAKKVAPDLHTYSVIISCCCQMGRLDLGFATFGQILKTGWTMNAIVFTHLLGALCAAKRTSDAMDIVLRRMPELGCTPGVIPFNTLLKGLCDESKSQDALKLLHKMADDGGSSAPNVVSYTIIIHGFFKQGQVDKAYSLFLEMLDHGISPDVVTCTSIIDGLCKAQAMDKAEVTLQQMCEKACGNREKAEVLFYKMLDRGIHPTSPVFHTMMQSLRKEGRVLEAQNLLELMVCAGVKLDVVS